MKKIIKSIACICLTLAVAIGSCFGAMKMSENQRFLGTSYNKASASSTPGFVPPSINDFTSFEGLLFKGSDVFFVNPTLMRSNSLVTDFANYTNSNLFFYDASISYYNTKFSLGLSSDSFYLSYIMVRSPLRPIYIKNDTTSPSYGSTIQTQYYDIRLNQFSTNSMRDDFTPNSVYNSYTATPMQKAIYADSTYYLNFGFEIYKDNSDVTAFIEPSLRMRYLVLCNSYVIEQYLGITPKFSNSNIICYIDTNGYYYLIYVPNGTPLTSDVDIYYYEYRRYILNEQNLTDNDYYNQGLLDGYNSGYNNGSISGYDDGFSQGLQEGYNNGYNVGLESSERLGFPALITSVIDIPVKVFTNLFNFDILGVNILTFITSLLTIALILAIVRKVKSE